MKDIGRVIAKHRKRAKLSQRDLAELLAERDISISNAGISAWEKGITVPNAVSLLAVCEILKINDIYTEFIGENPLDPFRDLNGEGTAKALDYIRLLELSGEYGKHTAETVDIAPRLMKVALTRASAGTGNFLDEENFETLEITEPVPKKADFGIYITGDSMEPRFRDGELVWIERTDHLSSGDIGLFFLDGMTYIKKYIEKSSGIFLVSLNPKYRPVEVGEYSTFKIFGRLASD